MKDLVDISAFLDVEPFQHLVEETIKPGAICESKKVLRITATGWLTGDAREFGFPQRSEPGKEELTPDEIWAAIRASAAIPALFPPVKLLKEVFIDGGVVQNTPINPAVKAEMTQLPESHIENSLDTFNRVYTAMLATMIDEDIASARWINEGIEVLERVEAGEDVDSETMRQFVRVAHVISEKLQKEGRLPSKLTIHRYYPNRALGDMLGMLNFHHASINDMINAGYADTCAHSCEENKCVIPEVVHRPKPEKSRAASTGS